MNHPMTEEQVEIPSLFFPVLETRGRKERRKIIQSENGGEIGTNQMSQWFMRTHFRLCDFLPSHRHPIQLPAQVNPFAC